MYHIYHIAPTYDGRDAQTGCRYIWCESHETIGWADERANRIAEEVGDPEFCIGVFVKDACGFPRPVPRFHVSPMEDIPY